MLQLVPLTLIIGGSAAARLAAQLCTDDPNVAVICSIDRLAVHSERGLLVVDADVASRTPGCGCCEVRIDLVDAVGRVVRRRRRPSRVLVLLDEVDDAVTVTYTVLFDAGLQRLVQLDGVVTVVDAVQLATRIHGDLAVDTDRGLDRLAIADRIVVARGRDVTPVAMGQIGHMLRSINQIAPVIVPSLTICTLDELVDIDAWHGAPSVGRVPAEPSPLLPPDAPRTIACSSAHPLDADLIDEWLDALIAEHATRLLRLQGAVRVPGSERHSCFYGIRSYAMNHTHPGDAGLPAAASSVVVIGRGLPAEELQASFAAAQLHP